MRQQRKTFADIRAESRGRADASLFARARAANSLAKCAGSANRRLLYGIKHRALQQLILHHRAVIRSDPRSGFERVLSVCMDEHHRLHCPLNVLYVFRMYP